MIQHQNAVGNQFERALEAGTELQKSTHSEPLRKTLSVWSYSDVRAPPGRSSAHSGPVVCKALKYSAVDDAIAVQSTTAIWNNLQTNKDK